MHDPVQSPVEPVAPALAAREALVPGVMLGIVALLASGALALASRLTTGPIAAAEANDLRQSLIEVLPAGFADNDFLHDTVRVTGEGGAVTVYRARKGGAVDGAMFQVSGYGYSSDVQLMMAVDLSGRILGVRVLKHAETPGLGDRIEIAKSTWILGFDGHSLDDPKPARWAVKKDGGAFDQLTGATITPRAVVKAVKGGLLFFEAHRQQILGDPR
ncbi:electron transport complex subunit RsxG [Nitrogeniibacter mangrovi]|uniref:Ion-translocating oxidoreductase complex subunit G n=1 Tax=Nitrogeniibacter mangrovi TaxID=2016596 RepID=A0A6C1B941_9RHOO|nr:electron transport complex subunit RsxG [Nitrogeniibacter mangrovi]QID19479.1 electron transport complex subunit RsxG [Nitrogeniibacter mangrovi]